MTYSQATAKLPADATLSCTFGYPGVGGYTEYHRDEAGNRFVIANGRWDDPVKVWTFACERTP